MGSVHFLLFKNNNKTPQKTGNLHYWVEFAINGSLAAADTMNT